jgi:putative endonuclease
MKELSYVYILANKHNTTLYVGITTNLIKRVWQHKNKVVKGFTEK